MNVSFNGGGVVSNPTSKTVKYKRTYGTTIPELTDTTEYYFKGWWTASSGGTQITNASTVTIAEDHTLYAHWERINEDPNTPTISVTDRYYNYITIKINGSDPDGDDLTFDVYANNSKKGTSSKIASGGNTTYKITGLSDYTNYSIYVVANDGKGGTAQSSSASAKTKCSGSGYTCTSGYECSGGSNTTYNCSTCDGKGYVSSWPCPYITWRCSTCDGYGNSGDETCPTCNGNAATCSMHPDLDSLHGYGDKCDSCGGEGTYEVFEECSHGYSGSHMHCSTHDYDYSTSTHQYCSHGKTYVHD